VTIQDLKQWLDIGLVKNGNMKKFHLKQIIKEQTEETVKQCPAPTQDLELNTLNRNRAIKADFIKYGPLN